MQQVMLASKFFQTFSIQILSLDTLVLTNNKNKIQVKQIRSSQQSDINLNKILDNHVQLDQKYILPLLKYSKITNGFRCFYQKSQKTLESEIIKRKQKQQYFSEEQIWVLLDSVVKSFLYLQSKQIVYGVLSIKKICMHPTIRLLDPSAFNINPVSLSRISVKSPQYQQFQQQIDFQKSDIYLLGVCILQAATLNINNPDQQLIKNMISQVNQKYSYNLLHVLQFMLQKLPQDRPTFDNIQQYIQKQIQIKQSNIWPSNYLLPDYEDQQYQLNYQPKQDLEFVDYDLTSQTQKISNQFQKLKQLFGIQSIKKCNYNQTISHSKQSNKQLQTVIRNKLQKPKSQFVSQFQIQHNKTIDRRKTSRVMQIKNRNSQLNKNTHYIIDKNKIDRRIILPKTIVQ